MLTKNWPGWDRPGIRKLLPYWIEAYKPRLIGFLIASAVSSLGIGITVAVMLPFPLLGVLAGLGVFLLFYAVVVLVYGARDYFRYPGAIEVLKADGRAPILYFRSFVDDGRSRLHPEWRPPGSSPTDEQALARLLAPIGPLVGLAPPRFPRPGSSAAQVRVSDSEWRVVVEELLECACLVVLRPGDSDALSWELRAAIRKLPPHRVLVFGSVISERGLTNFLSVLAHTTGASSINVTRGRTVFIAFQDDWSPVAIEKRQHSLSRNINDAIGRPRLPWRLDRDQVEDLFEHLQADLPIQDCIEEAIVASTQSTWNPVVFGRYVREHFEIREESQHKNRHAIVLLNRYADQPSGRSTISTASEP